MIDHGDERVIKIGKLSANWPNSLIGLLALCALATLLVGGFSQPALQAALFISAIVMALMLFNLIVALKSGNRKEWLDRSGRTIFWSGEMTLLAGLLNGWHSWAPVVLMATGISLQLFTFKRSSRTS